ncbi:AAA family ATPase [Flavobacterium branchiicola]|uniref:AAA family ATPase n=1 Tax=Flavobacterium branchiicola TaxID=1114875 RepID=A0ABV9PA24_9FLAO|nr:AAA family ATPase [Flavobacterium branchiicola]MBS7252504.1 AAA family ATPase [Flavobacterium branchiicola]
MRKIRKVKIDGFWGDKTVDLKFDEEINFLIGVNGSGKTTIINLIAASLNADFATLDKIEFNKIKINFFDLEDSDGKIISSSYIEVEKTDNIASPYSNILFKIKADAKTKIKTFKLNDIEEENLFRYSHNYLNDYRVFKTQRSVKAERDINIALKGFVNLTWLSIHRTNNLNRNNEEKGFESTIDLKVKELSTELVKYFGILDKRYSLETEKFQKNIFLSLIEGESKSDIFSISTELEPEHEKEALKQIFLLFKLQEDEFTNKLDTHFNYFEDSKKAITQKETVTLNHLASLVSTQRIHSIVQEWKLLNEMKININKPKFIFIDEINNLFQRKKVFINERNELLVETDSGKVFQLSNLSSGEKQLLIILGQSLLQENCSNIYIADEPELSLHVDWQEKLVKNLKNVNPNSQIIFATHSPDIVGRFSDFIIKVEEAII